MWKTVQLQAQNKLSGKLIAKIITVLFALLFVSACGAGDSETAAAVPRAAAGGAAEAPVAPAAAPAAAVDSSFAADGSYGGYMVAMQPEAAHNTADQLRHRAILDRMIIRNASLTIESERFDWAVFEIERIVDTYGGFIESSSRFTLWMREGELWRADYTLRVPVDNFDLANRDLKALATVLNFSTSSDDVTMQFQDIDSRLRIREEEERRILSMIENATDIEDLISLESRLSNVRLAMERYRRRMTEIDQLASFATIHLSLIEVESEGAAIPYDNFIGRVGEAFSGSVEISLGILEGIAMFAATVFLPLVVVAIPIVLVFLFLRKLKPFLDKH